MDTIMYLLILLSTTYCTITAQRENHGPPAPPPTNVAPPSIQSGPISQEIPSSTTCIPGELSAGPTCSSFYMCVSGRLNLSRKVLFQCAPGTMFSASSMICIHAYESSCAEASLPVNPPAAGPPSPFVRPPPQPAGPPSPTAPPPPIQTATDVAPQQQTDQMCPQFEIDPEGVYECIKPGHFPSNGDCNTFFTCINTMDCLIRGFQFKCPKGWLFNSGVGFCDLEFLVGPCDRIIVSDSPVTVQIENVFELSPQDLDQFFDKKNVYWHYMPFLPNETQRIVRIPSQYSRDGSVSFTMN